MYSQSTKRSENFKIIILIKTSAAGEFFEMSAENGPFSFELQRFFMIQHFNIRVILGFLEDL